MDRLLRGAGKLTLFLAAAGILLLSSLPAQSEEIAVDDETCLACHDGLELTLRGTTHALSSEMTKPATTVACVSCHSNSEVHIEDPNKENIGNPARMTGVDAIGACITCHQPHHEMGIPGADPHAGKEIGCVECHSVHNAYEGLLVDESAGFCGKCHVSTVNQFRSRSNHPVADGNVTCISCHDFTGKNEPDFGHGSSANCFSCHADYSGPHMYEHQAASSFSTEGGGGCITCHRPHGSPNERLLAQPGDMLCKQCHGVPPLHRTFHNGIGSQYGCIECHSAVHGSDDNPGLLDDFLGTKLTGDPTGCYCHKVGN